MAQLYSTTVKCENAFQIVDPLLNLLQLHPDQIGIREDSIEFDSEEPYLAEIAEISKMVNIPITVDGVEEFSDKEYHVTFLAGKEI